MPDSAGTCYIAFANLTETTLSSYLNYPRLPKVLIDQSLELKPVRRHQYLVCRALLSELLYLTCGIEQLPTIVISENSRPVFNDLHLPDFNISHSHQWVAVALMKSARIGFDIEVKGHKKNCLNLAEKFFSKKETDWLAKHDQSQQENAFLMLWTLREAILKLHAKGVWQMRQIELDPETLIAQSEFCPRPYVYHQQQRHFNWSVSSDKPLPVITLIGLNE